jgi:hypothetical protein
LAFADLGSRLKQPLLDITFYSPADFDQIPGIGLGRKLGKNRDIGCGNGRDFHRRGRRRRRGALASRTARRQCDESPENPETQKCSAHPYTL